MRLRTFSEALAEIAGRLWDGKDEDACIPPVRNALWDTKLDSITEYSLDRLSRTVLSMVVAIRCERMKRWGFKVRRWDVGKPGPGRTLDRDARRYYGFSDYRAESEGWVDHGYKLLRDGKTIYVSEPYQLGNDEIRELAALADQGWQVTIWPGRAIHFPGETMAVWVRKTESE